MMMMMMMMTVMMMRPTSKTKIIHDLLSRVFGLYLMFKQELLLD